MDDRPPPNGLCPRCGAPFPVEFKGEWWESGRRCAECGVGTAAEGFLVPSDDEVAHALGTWALTDRSAVTAALVELDIAYRWEPGLVLVVPAAADDHVAGLLDEVAGDADPGAIADPGDIDGAADDDGSAQAAMADLFDAVSRLSRAPADPIRADAVVAAAGMVDTSARPYGMEPAEWREIQRLASALAHQVQVAADEDAVAADARGLRDRLRNYV
jgi:hypothetical protein